VVTERSLSRRLAVLVLSCALSLILLVIALLLWLRPPVPVAVALMAIIAGALWMACAQARRIASDIGQVLARAHEANRQCAIEREQADAEKAAAQGADQKKDVFLATLSHELRGTLTAVIGWLEIGQSKLDDPAMLRNALEIALRNAKQEARIMDDLLDVSRIMSGKLALERRPVDLSRLAREALDASRPVAEAGPIDLRGRVHEPVFIEGDRHRILQAVGNLIGNALKFNRPGGWVELALERAGGQARLIVADNGAGIEEAAMPHIFERFWQAQPVAGARDRGLGLGLALVHYIVTLHGGRIHADSGGPGQGTRSTIELPALAGPTALPTDQPHAEEEVEESLNGLGVVAVDRNDDTLGWLQHLFAAHGAMTWKAQSVEQALALVEREGADVVVSDLAVIEEREDVIKALRAGTCGKRVAAVALSSRPTEEEYSRALAAGYDGFVAKPCDPAVLVRVLKAAVHRGPS
jgi:signal transduction histidine kinase/CheY-like chemotaxis protein